MNTSNNTAAKTVEDIGFEDVIVSPELTLPQIRDIGGARLALAYGKIPLMTVEKCVMREIASCEKCKANGWGYLIDRKGIRFAVRREWKHRNIIFNSFPVYMADKKDQLIKYNIESEHFIFSDESKEEADRIINAYRKALPCYS